MSKFKDYFFDHGIEDAEEMNEKNFFRCETNLYIDDINKIFDELESDGIVKIENQTVAYVGIVTQEV